MQKSLHLGTRFQVFIHEPSAWLRSDDKNTVNRQVFIKAARRNTKDSSSPRIGQCCRTSLFLTPLASVKVRSRAIADSNVCASICKTSSRCSHFKQQCPPWQCDSMSGTQYAGTCSLPSDLAARTNHSTRCVPGKLYCNAKL
jgi:hypothetical protein